MKRFLQLILLSICLITPFVASAQMDIVEPTSLGGREAERRVAFRDSIRFQQVTHDYFSRALYRHERHLLRQDRNSVEMNASLTGSMTNLSDSWIETSGGDNSVTLLSSFYLKHNFTKESFSLDTYFSFKFGYYRVMLDVTNDEGETEREPTWFKNQDEMYVTVTPSIKFSDNWSYGASLKFRTQIAKGYLSSSAQEDYNVKSSFMSPGYLDLSGGLIYKSPNSKYPFTVTLSPIALSATYVTNPEVRENSQYSYKAHTDGNYSYAEVYGINVNTRSEYEGGFSFQVDYSKSFGKDKLVTYTSSLYTFYGWLSQVTHKNVYGSKSEYEEAQAEWELTYEGVEPMLSILPTVRWENKLSIKTARYLTTTLDFQLYYNRAQNFKTQNQTLLSLGLAYTFKSK
ncbi:MAG: DUF3078 domain-containing protein [Rikenellaceae bacterium]